MLKRGIADQRSPLVRWCEAVLEAGLSQPIETKALTLRLLDEIASHLLGNCALAGIQCQPIIEIHAVRKNHAFFRMWSEKLGMLDHGLTRHDDSVGPHTGGTANHWINNRCGRENQPGQDENRPGLCENH